MKPSVGRIVHYELQGHGGNFVFHPLRNAYRVPCLAALVTNVNDDETVNLTCFLPNGGLHAEANVAGQPEGGIRLPGHWNWPPRVD